MQFLQEQDLILRLKKGEAVAVTRWYTETKGDLLRFFTLRVPSDADAQELVHDTYLSCLSSLPLFRGESGLWTFMLSIARHELADYWRKSYAKHAISMLPFGSELLGTIEDKADQAEETRIKNQEGSEIQELLTKLPQEISELLQLKYVDDKSVKELAVQYNLSFSAMQSKLFRAKELFKHAYTEISRSGD